MSTKLLMFISAVLLFSSTQAEANVRSIIDIGGDSRSLNSSDIDTGINTDTFCPENGYTLTSCNGNKIPDETSRCPNNAKYFKYCLCDTSYYNILLGKNETINDVCGKLAATESCSDKKGSHYICHCATSLTLCNSNNEYIDSSNLLKTGSFCRTGRNQSTLFQTSACLSCEAPLVVNASKTGCSCPAEYKECDMGPEVGASSCTENGITKYDNCKDCANLGTYAACPAGYTCTFEDCSDKYYITGCATGYSNIEECSWKCMFSKIMPKN